METSIYIADKYVSISKSLSWSLQVKMVKDIRLSLGQSQTPIKKLTKKNLDWIAHGNKGFIFANLFGVAFPQVVSYMSLCSISMGK
jgi:hypothetical protein